MFDKYVLIVMDSYKNNSRKFAGGKDWMQKHLYEHFQLPGHTGVFLQDVYVTLFNKAKTPIGLNFEGGY